MNHFYLVSQRRPLVQLDEPLAVLASTSSCTKLYKCSYFAGLVKYLFSNLYDTRSEEVIWLKNIIKITESVQLGWLKDKDTFNMDMTYRGNVSHSYIASNVRFDDWHSSSKLFCTREQLINSYSLFPSYHITMKTKLCKDK